MPNERKQITDLIIRAGGVDVVATLWEAKNAPAIIICHGLSSDRKGKAKQLAQALHKVGFTVLTFDFRGHGESGGRFEDLTLSGSVSDLRAAIKHLSTEGRPVGVIGSSWGGLVALNAAAECKEIRAVAVLGTPYSFEEEKFLENVRKEMGLEWGQSIGGKALKQGFWNELTGLELGGIKQPLLVIHGENDEVVPLKHASVIAGLSTTSKTVVVEGGTHSLNESLDEIKPVLSRFFGRHLPQ